MHSLHDLRAAVSQVAALHARGLISDPAYELVSDDIMTRHSAGAEVDSEPVVAKRVKFRDTGKPFRYLDWAW